MGGFLFSELKRYLTLKALHFFSVLMLLCLVGVVFTPGLGGFFLLDDYGSLAPLGDWGQINTFAKWWDYVATAYNGPNGRVIATASFTLNAITWPANPFWFLVTNLIIHIFNCLLLFYLLKQLFTLANIKKAFALALVAAAIWALHPLQVSTVLYVVQRMAQLEFTFNILALIAYLQFRISITQHAIRRSITYLALTGFCGLLALLSKETAVLIPLQLAIIELFLRYSHSQLRWPNRYWVWVVVWLPLLLLIYLLVAEVLRYYTYPSSMERRGFTVVERVLTQQRIVGDYLALWFVPKIQTAGVFHDGYPISKSILSPVSTLVWLCLHVGVVLASVVVRKRWPVLTLGVLWFYGNHIIESSVILLELKYEHRNYLPTVGLSLVCAWALLSLPVGRALRRSLIGLVVLSLSFATYSRANLWGNPKEAVLVWIEENPNSSRALENAILYYSQQPGFEVTVKSLLAKGLLQPNPDIAIVLKAMSLDCSFTQQPRFAPSAIVERLKTVPIHWQMGGFLEGVLLSIHSGGCTSVTKGQYLAMLDAIASNPAFKSTRVHWVLADLRARAEFLLGDRAKALVLYANIRFTNGMLAMKMNQALFLASNHFQKAAADILETAIVSAGQEDQRLIEPAKDMLNRIMKDVKNDQ